MHFLLESPGHGLMILEFYFIDRKFSYYCYNIPIVIRTRKVHEFLPPDPTGSYRHRVSLTRIPVELLTFILKERVSSLSVYKLRSRNETRCYVGKQEFRRTDFGSRLLAAEGEGKQYPSGSG